MTPAHDEKRTEAIAALAKIAMWEGVVLVAVVAAYFMTGKVWVLLAGLAASMALFAPMFLRWIRDYGQTMKPNSIEENGSE